MCASAESEREGYRMHRSRERVENDAVFAAGSGRSQPSDAAVRRLAATEPASQASPTCQRLAAAASELVHGSHSRGLSLERRDRLLSDCHLMRNAQVCVCRTGLP